ncbi:nucleotidyltransferase family protein [Thiohalocapsa marina]|nr:nucleotidyltransferase family protein [Thiohalocapsa marina]
MNKTGVEQTLGLLRDWLESEAQSARHPHNVASLPDLPTHGRWLDAEGLLPVLAGLATGLRLREPDRDHDPLPDPAWRAQRLNCVGRSLRLKIAGAAVRDALDAWGGPWAFIKGFALARSVYEYPWMRLAADIDLLVRPQDLDAAVAALRAAGARPIAGSVQGHERALTVRGVEIDLHNAPMSKGRLRHNPAERWLGRRCRIDGYPCLSAHDELLLSLIHPAVTEYLAARLVRMLDIALQVRRSREPVDWPRLADDARRLGLANAAFATAIRVNHLFSSGPDALIPLSFMNALRVDPLRRRYWRFWLDRQPDQLFRRSPLRAGLLFGLWLNDSPRDLLRALDYKRRHW